MNIIMNHSELAYSTVLYADVNGEYDKLVTDDGHRLPHRPT